MTALTYSPIDQVPKFEAIARSDLVSYFAGVSRKDPTRNAAYDVQILGASSSLIKS
jgi:hypothetical protein